MNPSIERRRPSYRDLSDLVGRLQNQVEQLSHNPTFGCLTRLAVDVLLQDMNLNGLAVVYWDIDKLKSANVAWGKKEASDRIRQAIAARGTDCVMGQVFSGDEFVAFPPLSDAYPMACRIQSRLQEQDMSATFLITAPLPGETIPQILDRLDGQSDHYKAIFGRGQIYTVI